MVDDLRSDISSNSVTGIVLMIAKSQTQFDAGPCCLVCFAVWNSFQCLMVFGLEQFTLHNSVMGKLFLKKNKRWA